MKTNNLAHGQRRFGALALRVSREQKQSFGVHLEHLFILIDSLINLLFIYYFFIFLLIYLFVILLIYLFVILLIYLFVILLIYLFVS